MFARALRGEDDSERRRFDARCDRKTLQLCEQVRRTLSQALQGECDDDLLRELDVESVEPMGNGAQLLVRVSVPGGLDVAPWEVVARLNGRAARLRALVARSICRKRVPGLSFIAVPRGADLGMGVDDE
jgi:ribosome-binding factor A